MDSFKISDQLLFFHTVACAGDDQPLESARMTGFDGVGNEQLMVERSSEGWGRQRRTVVRVQEEEAHMEEIREGVVVQKEPPWTAGVKSHQPQLLHRAPWYKFTILIY